MIPFVDLHAQYKSIQSDIDTAIQNVIVNSEFIRGAPLERFEAAFAELCTVRHVNCVGSGTEALHMALRALEIGPGDEVITVTNTWISTSFVIDYVGATPVLVDVDPYTYQMDPAALERAITPKTKAVIAVHLYGHPAPMAEIVKICRKNGVYIIEDVAQAILAEVDGMQTGTIGDIGCYSFYPSKNLGCYGDGGAVITNRDDIAEKLRILTNYGQSKPFVHDTIGYNNRLDTIQAAILHVKLSYLEAWNRARQQHAETYITALSDLPLQLPLQRPNAKSVYHLFVIEVDNRDACIAHLAAAGISVQIHYPTPIHLQPCYRHLGYRLGEFPVAEAAAGRILSLPIYAELTNTQIKSVVGSLTEFMSS